MRTSTYTSVKAIRIIACALFLGILLNGHTQDKVKFYDIIQEDSVRLYFNDHMEYTSEMCASFARSIRLNIASQFNGDFKDVSSKNRLLGKGRYINGIKNGKFSIYHNNGKLKCKGLYLNNKPMGRWEYFYDNGQAERTLIITNNDTLLVSLFSYEGDTLVIKGQGDFMGYVSGIKYSKDELYAFGKIKDGKPDSIWNANLNGEKFCTEYYEKGKYLKTIKEYRQKPEKINRVHLYSFHRKNYLAKLEEFIVNDCYESKLQRSKEYKFDAYKFSSDIEPGISQILNSDFSRGRTGQYNIGKNFMIVSFNINSNKKPCDFKLLSKFGQQYMLLIKSKLHKHTEFPENTGPFYLRIILTYYAGYNYSYAVEISEIKPSEY